MCIRDRGLAAATPSAAAGCPTAQPSSASGQRIGEVIDIASSQGSVGAGEPAPTELDPASQLDEHGDNMPKPTVAI
eukprot:7176020-Alexandrium_andersonii.AAC.1